MVKNEIGIYIHIPFCKQKCYYCDFISFDNKNRFMDEYCEALMKEIEYIKISSKKNLEEKKVTTIYIGGGTPSIINSKYIEQILNKIRVNYNVAKEAEITIEINPGTIDEKKLNAYKLAGINRLSIGLQETDNKLLKSIGRIHTYEQFLKTYNLAKSLEFNNINVDLMIGLPNQTLDNVKKSIKNIMELQPQHISVYSLIVEENTPISKMIEQKQLIPLDENIERRMYWYVKDVLEVKNYIHYEISNFAKQGFESMHNLNCWNQYEYLGFGLAAHSYFNKERYSNTEDLEEYINNISIKNFIKNKQIHEKQNKKEEEKEYMLLGLRKIEGITITEFFEKFGEDPVNLFKEELKRLVKYNLILIRANRIKLTPKGLDLANLVWEEFV